MKTKTKIPQERGEKTELEVQSEALLDSLKSSQDELTHFYEDMALSGDPRQYEAEAQQKIQSYKRANSNIRNAYKQSVEVCDELTARWNDLQRSLDWKLVPHTPANAVIDLEEKRLNHFAQGMNVYKLMLVCFIGCFACVVIETIWCLLTNGYIESRAGLVYGPFNMLYGMGAALMTAALYQYRNKGKWISFLGGFIVGSVVEYACSWWQETCFGSVSWDYSHLPFNLNGRICLLYSVYWGILGVVWMKIIYPWMAKLILKIPNKHGKAIAWGTTAFLVVNCGITLIAVFRWSQRIDMIAPSNEFWAFIDVWFPNERMERIFANMVFG